MKKASTIQQKQMSVDFTIIVKNNIVETVLSHTGEHLLFNVIDLDLCKMEGTNPRLALEADQFYFTQSTEQIVPLQKLQNEL